MTRPVGSFMQLAYVLDDMDRYLEFWTKEMSAGPFFRGDFTPENQVYRGEPTSAGLSVAFGFHGDMQIELIQPLDDKPSVFAEGLAARGTGIHHIFAPVKNYDAAVADYARSGCLPVQTSSHPVFGRIAIIDASRYLGTYVEVVEANPAMHAFNVAMLRAQDGWDGTRPVRPVTELHLPGIEEI